MSDINARELVGPHSLQAAIALHRETGLRIAMVTDDMRRYLDDDEASPVVCVHAFVISQDGDVGYDAHGAFPVTRALSRARSHVAVAGDTSDWTYEVIGSEAELKNMPEFAIGPASVPNVAVIEATKALRASGLTARLKSATTPTDPACPFFESYLTTLLSYGCAGEDGPAEIFPAQLSPEALREAKAECVEFLKAHRDVILAARHTCADTDAERLARAGADFYHTRVGGGAGFWDGDWSEPASEILDQASVDAGHIDLYEGDDGFYYALVSKPQPSMRL